MSKVYLVVYSDYEEYNVLAAYLDEDKAKIKFKEEKKKLELLYEDRYHSSCITLDDFELND